MSKLIFPKSKKIVIPKNRMQEKMLLAAGAILYTEKEEIIKLFSIKNLNIEVKASEVQKFINEGWSLEPIQEEKKELEPKRGRRE